MNIRGKLALVTGASSGIGAATAHALANAGARVLLVARSADKLQALADQIKAAGGEAFVVPADLMQTEAVWALAEQVVRDFGVPDILINNAGAGRWLTVEETAKGEAEKMMALPYFAAFNLTRALLPQMKARGGAIVNVNSVAVGLTWPGATAYAAARAAIGAFSNGLAAELRGSGINVTHAIFGKVASDYWQHNPGSEPRLPKINAYLPTLTPETVAKAIVCAIVHRRRKVVRPRLFVLFFALNILFPRITGSLLSMGWQRPREQEK